MKYAVVFLALGLCCAFTVASSPLWPVKLAAATVAVAFSGVGLAYAFVGPRAFGKRSDGRLGAWSYLVFGPYHALNWLSLKGFRRSAKENAFDQIAPNVYLGCRLDNSDRETIRKLGFASVLDLTCEFGEAPALRGLTYKCIPILDTRAPSPNELREGAHWIERERRQGPVYVHCALGHGRSATFVAVHLLLSGQAQTPEEAVAKIRALRPKIGLHPEQMAVLEKLQH